MDFRPDHGPLQDSFVEIPNTRFPTTEQRLLYYELKEIYGLNPWAMRQNLLNFEMDIDEAIKFPSYNATDSRINFIQKLKHLNFNTSIAKRKLRKMICKFWMFVCIMIFCWSAPINPFLFHY